MSLVSLMPRPLTEGLGMRLELSVLINGILESALGVGFYGIGLRHEINIHIKGP